MVLALVEFCAISEPWRKYSYDYFNSYLYYTVCICLYLLLQISGLISGGTNVILVLTHLMLSNRFTDFFQFS